MTPPKPYPPPNTHAGVSSFVAEFVKRKLAEKNRKPSGKKKKGAAAAAAGAGGAGAAAPIGVNAAAVGLVNAGEVVAGLWGFAASAGVSGGGGVVTPWFMKPSALRLRCL